LVSVLRKGIDVSNPLLRARNAIELIAAPMRPDSTYNRDREECRALALQALAHLDAALAAQGEPAAWVEVVAHAARELEELDDETAQAQANALRELLASQAACKPPEEGL
jgi:hypothetical protein